MHTSRSVLLAACALALCINAQADPKQKQGQPNNPGQSGQGHAKNKGQSSDSDYERQVQSYRQRDYDEDYDEDSDTIYEIFQKNRGQYAQPQALPPGIAKNLARGKPLPPGIAKRFNPQLASQLPYYPGYEWQQVGSDAVLVNTTSQVIQEVLRGVLQ